MFKQNRYAEAIFHFKETLEGFREYDLDVEHCHQRIAQSYAAINDDITEIKKSYYQYLNILSSRLEDSIEKYLNVVSNFLVLLESHDQWSDIEILCDQHLDHSIAIFGKTHFLTNLILRLSAQKFERMNDFSKAYEIYKSMMEANRVRNSPENIIIQAFSTTCLARLTRVYLDDNEESKNLYKQALLLYEESSLGDGCIEVGEIHIALADLSFNEAHARLAFEIVSKHIGSTSPQALHSLNILIEILDSNKKWPDKFTEAIQREIEDKYTFMMNVYLRQNDVENIIETGKGLSKFYYYDQRSFEKAKRLYAFLVDVIFANHRLQNPFLGECCYNLASILQIDHSIHFLRQTSELQLLAFQCYFVNYTKSLSEEIMSKAQKLLPPLMNPFNPTDTRWIVKAFQDSLTKKAPAASRTDFMKKLYVHTIPEILLHYTNPIENPSEEKSSNHTNKFALTAFSNTGKKMTATKFSVAASAPKPMPIVSSVDEIKSLVLHLSTREEAEILSESKVNQLLIQSTTLSQRRRDINSLQDINDQSWSMSIFIDQPTNVMWTHWIRQVTDEAPWFRDFDEAARRTLIDCRDSFLCTVRRCTLTSI